MQTKHTSAHDAHGHKAMATVHKAEGGHVMAKMTSSVDGTMGGNPNSSGGKSGGYSAGKKGC